MFCLGDYNLFGFGWLCIRWIQFCCIFYEPNLWKFGTLSLSHSTDQNIECPCQYYSSVINAHNMHMSSISFSGIDFISLINIFMHLMFPFLFLFSFLQEPWLMCLMLFHFVLLLIVIMSRKNINFQMCLFLLACKFFAFMNDLFFLQTAH